MNFNVTAAEFQGRLEELEKKNALMAVKLDVMRNELFKRYSDFLEEKSMMEINKAAEIEMRRLEMKAREKLQAEVDRLTVELNRLRAEAQAPANEPAREQAQKPAIPTLRGVVA
ncbi:hypothetical protein [Chromobacterium amazonense]|uniref:Transposase n=1 Tax=Chromobacterium amazonense TaxID=1382803 RepID=A0ABU8UY81_9NEIS|nr:hypothetical protein [Chromobacterium amazonense]MDQ4540969.1 hypothetical protein [Chromobacterium amazonense]